VSEAQLNILNYALLALIYLFFARVLWAVWSEVRGPRAGTTIHHVAASHATAPDATAHAARPDGTAATAPPARARRPPRGRKGAVSRLVVLQPKVRKGAAYSIGDELTLGRATSCGIGLPDDTFASQLHARVYARDGGAWVEDLGSTNGTHLNGARLTAPMQLEVGDRVQVGSTIFEAR